MARAEIFGIETLKMLDHGKVPAAFAMELKRVN